MYTMNADGSNGHGVDTAGKYSNYFTQWSFPLFMKHEVYFTSQFYCYRVTRGFNSRHFCESGKCILFYGTHETVESKTRFISKKIFNLELVGGIKFYAHLASSESPAI